MLKAMSAPYGDVRFMPTGGINEKNLLAYLSFPKVVACGGSFMVSEKLVDSGDYDAVTALTEKAVSLMLGCRLAHIGVNSAGREEAAAAADFLCRAFGFGRTEGPVSVFASDLEIMHGAGRGRTDISPSASTASNARCSRSAAGACALTRPPSGSARTASPILSIWRTSCSALPSISSVTIERKEL